MYVCMYVCMHVCMHACMHVRMYDVCMTSRGEEQLWVLQFQARLAQRDSEFLLTTR